MEVKTVTCLKLQSLFGKDRNQVFQIWTHGLTYPFLKGKTGLWDNPLMFGKVKGSWVFQFGIGTCSEYEYIVG